MVFVPVCHESTEKAFNLICSPLVDIFNLWNLCVCQTLINRSGAFFNQFSSRINRFRQWNKEHELIYDLIRQLTKLLLTSFSDEFFNVLNHLSPMTSNRKRVKKSESEEKKICIIFGCPSTFLFALILFALSLDHTFITFARALRNAHMLKLSQPIALNNCSLRK